MLTSITGKMYADWTDEADSSGSTFMQEGVAISLAFQESPSPRSLLPVMLV
jgi:hypothetical protein